MHESNAKMHTASWDLDLLYPPIQLKITMLRMTPKMGAVTQVIAKYLYTCSIGMPNAA